MAITFHFTRIAWSSAPAVNNRKTVSCQNAGLSATLSDIRVLIRALSFFCYTGIELGYGLWLYTILIKSNGFSPSLSGIITGGYWALFTVGRIVAGFLTNRTPIRSILLFCLTSILSATLGLVSSFCEMVTILCVLLAGLALGPMFPALISETKNIIPRNKVSNAIGIQIAAAGLGGSFIPAYSGYLMRIANGKAVLLFLLFLEVILIMTIFSLREKDYIMEAAKHEQNIILPGYTFTDRNSNFHRMCQHDQHENQ